jgi:hypothetical protein
MKLSKIHERVIDSMNKMTKEDFDSATKKAHEDSCDSYIIEDVNSLEERYNDIVMMLNRILVNANGILRDINEQDKVYIQASSIVGLITFVQKMIGEINNEN